jgi:FixJ family two-component response regulator
VHIVDDDASFRTAMERRLTKAGYEVATYASAQHLLDRLPLVFSFDPRCHGLFLSVGFTLVRVQA